jgi:hypothetical protein
MKNFATVVSQIAFRLIYFSLQMLTSFSQITENWIARRRAGAFPEQASRRIAMFESLIALSVQIEGMSHRLSGYQYYYCDCV